jgi:hypothetical protein
MHRVPGHGRPVVLQPRPRGHGSTRLRFPHVISIQKVSDPEHVRENAAAIDIALTAEDLAEIDAAHKPPAGKRPLDLL